MPDKKYSPKEAAIAVLNLAAELYKSSYLAKAETGHEKGVHTQMGGVAGLSQAGNKAGPWHGSQGPIAGSGPVDKQGAVAEHTRVIGEMKQIKPNIPEPMGKTEAPMKGHIKLAKFVGRMEAKRGKPVDKAETGHEKGVHVSSDDLASKQQGISETGINARADAMRTHGNSSGYAKNKAVAGHKQVLDEMKAMPKPKLPG
jgi:hypothetical protein